jgi:phosphoserine phosphatase
VKLLVLDVEGTLFRTEVRLPGTSIDSTIWQGIAHALGPEAVREEVETHKRWEKGGYSSYLEWMKDTISIHVRHGLSYDLFQHLISSAQYNPTVVETLSQVDRTAYELLLISGGFRELAIRAQRDLKIPHAFAACEYLFGKDGSLEAYNLLPCDFEGKLDFIQLMLREYGLGSKDWVFVGDGSNDVPIAKSAPVSVGYRAHPALKKVVMYAIDEFYELADILKLSRVAQEG